MSSKETDMARHITSDGFRFYVDGEPATAIAAHKALVEDHDMDDRGERIELLDSLKAYPEETR